MTWLTNKWVIFGGLALGILTGFYLGHLVASQTTNRVQLEFDTYRLEVLQSVNESNALVLANTQQLQDNLNQIVQQLAQDRSTSLAFSNTLLKGLNDAKGTSCALSPAIERYITSLLNRGLRDN